jgi:3-methyl-2-oxobutanoate hydroxymethyltransferase
VRNTEQLGHLVVQEAFAGAIGLDPLSVENELWNRALAGVGNDLGRSAWGGFDVDFGVGDGVLAEETLCLAAIAAPVGGIDKKLHTAIVAHARFGGKGILRVFGPHLRQHSGAALERTMSLTQLRENGASMPVRPVTAQTLLEMKQAGHAITALTAYDYPTARLVDQAGIDLILVGDSVGMAVLGYESTLPVTMDEMLHHTRAVARGVERAFLVADMPFGSYHSSPVEALHNATRFIKEAGAHAVKIEGGRRRVDLVRQMTEAEISVVAHIGLTPQSIHRMSGYRVQGRSMEAIESLYADALALEAAGAVAIVLEGIPREVATEITARCAVPTIGIGAGPECDGQILVFHDLFNLTFSSPAKFVRRYADATAFFGSALERYREDVAAHTFPSDEESYHLSREVRTQLETTEHRADVLEDNKDPLEHLASLEPAGRA